MKGWNIKAKIKSYHANESESDYVLQQVCFSALRSLWNKMAYFASWTQKFHGGEVQNRYTNMKNEWTLQYYIGNERHVIQNGNEYELMLIIYNISLFMIQYCQG